MEGQTPIGGNETCERFSISDLITQAREGNQVGMGQLAELAEARLLPYIYRLTLNYDLTQELCQQTLAKMIQSIGDSERIDRFWSWLYRSAMGEVQHYYRDLQRERLLKLAALNKAHLNQYETYR